MYYLNAALSHASGVSTAGRLSVAKSTTLSGDATDASAIVATVVVCMADDDVDCILSKFPTKLKRSDVSVSNRYDDDDDGSDDGLFSDVGVGCWCCKFNKFSFRLFDRRTIVREPWPKIDPKKNILKIKLLSLFSDKIYGYSTLLKKNPMINDLSIKEIFVLPHTAEIIYKLIW